MGYGKWIAGALGWAFKGPIGGIVGFLVGSLLEGSEQTNRGTGSRKHFSVMEERNSFLISLLILASAIMKANGKVMKSELDYVQNFLISNFGRSAAEEASIYLRDLLKKDVNVVSVGGQIKQYMNYESRIQLLHFLTGIARADGSVVEAELGILKTIALAMGVSERESEAVFAMFDNGVDTAYQVLEIDRSATDEEVRKAYRKLVSKHHPDKVASLGADVQKAAEERFKKISEAYEKIRRERGMN